MHAHTAGSSRLVLVNARPYRKSRTRQIKHLRLQIKRTTTHLPKKAGWPKACCLVPVVFEQTLGLHREVFRLNLPIKQSRAAICAHSPRKNLLKRPRGRIAGGLIQKVLSQHVLVFLLYSAGFKQPSPLHAYCI